jgi:hypothetical protein
MYGTEAFTTVVLLTQATNKARSATTTAFMVLAPLQEKKDANMKTFNRRSKLRAASTTVLVPLNTSCALITLGLYMNYSMLQVDRN